MKNYYGVIAEKIDERDYLASDVEIPRAPRGTNSFVLNGATQYNQKDVSPVSCTVHGAIGAYSDLTGYKFQLEERQEIWQEALNRGANPDKGWYILDAVALVREWVNENCDDKVDYYRTIVGTGEYGEIMRKGYSPIVGYSGNKLYNADRDDDGILNNIDFSTATYGHCIRTNYSIGDEFDRLVDNYPYRNTNLYLVPTSNWNDLMANNVFFKSAYIYLLK